MTRLEEFNRELGETIHSLENTRAEIAKLRKEGADEAKVKEQEDKAERVFADLSRVKIDIEQEQKLEDEKTAFAAREQAARDQSPARSDSTRVMDAHDHKNELTREDIAHRSELNERYALGEPLSDDEKVFRNRLTNGEKLWFRLMKAPPGRFSFHAVPAEFEMPTDWRAESTTAQVGTDADGGHLVPETLAAEVIRSTKAYGPMNDPGVARQINTAMGEPLTFPTVNDTGNKGVWIAEHTDAASKKVTWGDITVNAHKGSTDFFAVTREIMQDSVINFQRELTSLMGERVGRLLNEGFTKGDGSGKPTGLVNTIGAVAAQVQNVGTAVNIDFVDLLNLVAKVDPSYRGPGRFMFNSATETALLSVQDGDDRFLWQPDIAAGTRGRILGYPYMINQDMDNYNVANKDAVIFGDFSKFLIRRVRGLAIRRLDELLAKSDQVAFLGFFRVDSKVLDSRAFAVLHTDAT